MTGAAGVIHIAGSYLVGIPASERPAMYEANVGATQRVLDAAIAAGVPRIVYISTVNVFGNTHGRIVDETYHRDLAEGFVSYYDETKYLAHVAAEARIEAGAPDRHRPARDGLRGWRPFRDRGATQGRLRRDRRRSSPSRAPASRRHSWTTSPAGSSGPSIADASARHTS